MLDVVLVDDDVDFVEELSASLSRAGFRMAIAHNYQQLCRVLDAQKMDLVLLDIGLPGDDGFAVLQRLQPQRAAIGVIMLTARGETGDRVRGLMSGADGYLVKPVDIAELSATLHAVARRLPHRNVQGAETPSRWCLAENGWQLMSPEGLAFTLTAQERDFMQAMLPSVGTQKTILRTQLMHHFGRDPAIFDDHFIDTLVSRLRSKLGKDFPLRTVRGAGYTLSGVVVLA